MDEYLTVREIGPRLKILPKFLKNRTAAKMTLGLRILWGTKSVSR